MINDNSFINIANFILPSIRIWLVEVTTDTHAWIELIAKPAKTKSYNQHQL